MLNNMQKLALFIVYLRYISAHNKITHHDYYSNNSGTDIKRLSLLKIL